MLQHLGQLRLISLIASGGVHRALRGLARLTFRPGSSSGAAYAASA